MSKINMRELLGDREAGTPGPWRAERNGDVYRIVYNKIGNWCAEVIVDGDEVGAHADKCRIARLPDLESAYIEAVEVIKELSVTGSWILGSPALSRARNFLGDKDCHQ